MVVVQVGKIYQHLIWGASDLGAGSWVVIVLFRIYFSYMRI